MINIYIEIISVIIEIPEKIARKTEIGKHNHT